MKKMIKLMTATALVFGATSVMAATTGSLVLQGTVPQLVSIDVTANSNTQNIPLDQTQSNLVVGSVVESSNSNSGYNVQISSSNAGKLVHDSETSSFIAYSLTYGGSAIDLSTTDTVEQNTAGSYEVTKNVAIAYTGVDHKDLIEGNYSDTVTFTISAN